MKHPFHSIASRFRDLPPRHAFTLIELVVVLVLIGVLTHLLVGEMSRFQTRRLNEAADTQLESLRLAIAGSPDYRDATGARIREGFVADMGRAPRALRIYPDDAGSPLSLRELWERPSDVAEFALRPATAENLLPSCASLADQDVCVPCGWRGPYIQLPISQTRLRDPWGNTIETPDTASSPRIFGADTNAVVSEGEEIVWVRHLGADGRDDSLAGAHGAFHALDRDRWLRVDADSDARPATSLLVTTRVLDSTGCADAMSIGRSVTGVLYSPCGSAITAAVETATLPAGASVNLRFKGLTPGTRILRLRLGGLAPEDPMIVGVVHSLRLQPGDNSFVETFRTDSQVVAP